MDGYAFRMEDSGAGSEFTLTGESLAGHPYTGNLASGECIRITTGAAVPDCTDTVVIQENCVVQGRRVSLTKVPEQGANIRVIGHDVQAGAPIVRKNQRLNALDVGWLAACGVTELNTFSPPRIALFSTGDELVLPGMTLRDGQIFDSNRIAVAALLEALPAQVTDLGILPDDMTIITDSLSAAAADHDLLLTSGGVSVGDADYVKEAVASLGSIDLWKMNLKPGKPLAFGHVGDTPFLGLPGNPVSTIVTFLLIARPLILKMSGAAALSPRSQRARLGSAIRHSPGRDEYQRGILVSDEGQDWVQITGDQSSNRMATFSGANCLIRIPKTVGDLAEGDQVDVLPFDGLLS